MTEKAVMTQKAGSRHRPWLGLRAASAGGRLLLARHQLQRIWRRARRRAPGQRLKQYVVCINDVICSPLSALAGGGWLTIEKRKHPARSGAPIGAVPRIM